MSSIEERISDVVAQVVYASEKRIIERLDLIEQNLLNFSSSSNIPGRLDLHSFMKPTLEVADVARYLQISKYTVLNRIKQGKLKAYKQGRRWRIKREWLIEFELSISLKQ